MHAEVKPLDLSGVPTVAVGIGAWLIALVVLLIFRSELEARGEEWWIWVAVAGTGLGLIGLFYTRRRWAAIEGHLAAGKHEVADWGVPEPTTELLPSGKLTTEEPTTGQSSDDSSASTASASATGASTEGTASGTSSTEAATEAGPAPSSTSTGSTSSATESDVEADSETGSRSS
ncbi:DUF2530 domain-containing protein [Kribbella sp. NBC_01245]|uniref:DUF2530 domain-containing protein n=1 Tax=Kribbella sp. NBC_01245 TaxID=2903578 RepID=UPI003FA5E5FD